MKFTSTKDPKVAHWIPDCSAAPHPLDVVWTDSDANREKLAHCPQCMGERFTWDDLQKYDAERVRKLKPLVGKMFTDLVKD